MRLIPGKTKVKIELFRGVTIGDIVVGVITLALIGLVLMSTLPGRYYIAIGVLAFGGLMIMRIDAQPNYRLLLNLIRYIALPKRYWRTFTDAHLFSKNQEVKKGDNWNEFFSDKYVPEEEITLRESIEKAMVEKKKRKEEDELLNSKDATDEEKNAVWQARMEQEAQKKKKKQDNKDSYKKDYDMEDLIAFTGINDGYIEYNGKYYGTVIEIDPIEFRFFSSYRRDASIENYMGRIIRSLRIEYSANIVKIDRPILYNQYLDKEYDKLEALRTSYEKGMFNEEELKSRVEIQYDRIHEMRRICYEDKVIQPFYYLVLFNINKKQLTIDTTNAVSALEQGELTVRRLETDRDLAIFLKYTNTLDFDEWDIDKLDPKDYAAWAMPESVSFTSRYALVNKVVTHQMRVVSYPSVAGDSWLAGVMSIPATKVVVKITPMERIKSIRAIDRSLQELRGQLNSTGIDSKRIELESHIQTLSQLLVTLQQENESLLTVNIYISMYDAVRTTELSDPEAMKDSSLPIIADMKKTVRRYWQEIGTRLNGMDFEQLYAFIGSQVSGYDPYLKDGRGMPANTIAAMYPWIYARVSDVGGIRLGTHDGVPVIIDFFRRDAERVNSNMVIIGKSGSGKSYGTKSLLTNMASEDAKIFILDPENEYTELAHTLHGKIINVGNAKLGRLNPFHIITTLEDDETDENTTGSSFSAHLQFLEEFFKQILPDVEKDALEYLNSLVERLYSNFGITMETDLSKLSAIDYPIFDDLYDIVLEDFQRTNNEYLRNMLQTLINYVSKFATGGRNANIWNGPSSITTDENFSVFNFQSLLSNRNSTIANAQMLLVLKYIDNEIIKNRDYNRKYGLNRKIVVVIDEAHVFIDTKYPIALDFMFQLAKRIRKYNGMQIVITQNIKDFVGSEEIARKSTAIINACQYSFIFGLAPNDMDDLCKLYEKAGGINEVEQDQIVTAPRGMAFTVMSPTSRSSFKIEVPQPMVDMFEQPDYQTHYFSGEQGAQYWEDFVAGSREEHDRNAVSRRIDDLFNIDEYEDDDSDESSVTFSEISAEEADKMKFEPAEKRAAHYSADEDEEEMHPVSASEGITFREVMENSVAPNQQVPPVQQVMPGQTIMPGQTVLPGQPYPYPYVQPVPGQPLPLVSPVPVAQPQPAIDMNELINAIRAEVKREMAEQMQSAGVVPAQQPAQPEYQQPEQTEEPEPDEPEGYELESTEPETPESDYGSFASDDDDSEQEETPSEFGGFSFDDIDDDDDELGGFGDSSFDDDEDEGGSFTPKFDIMALLDEQLESYGEMSLDERMEEIDVNTMEISLDELATHIKRYLHSVYIYGDIS